MFYGDRRHCLLPEMATVAQSSSSLFSSFPNRARVRVLGDRVGVRVRVRVRVEVNVRVRVNVKVMARVRVTVIVRVRVRVIIRVRVEVNGKYLGVSVGVFAQVVMCTVIAR